MNGSNLWFLLYSSNDTVGGFKNASNRHTEDDKSGDVLCTIDESIKGVASLRRYDITFDDNIDIKYKKPPVFLLTFFPLKCSNIGIFFKA